MTKVGFTGHQNLDDPSGWEWVKTSLLQKLEALPQPLTGITSLAIGSDQLFARQILSLGGRLECVIPFADYQRTFEGSDLKAYHHLLQKAQSVEKLAWNKSDEASYLAAGKRVVDLSECVFTVWDGQPARGLGGTADVVNYARSIDRKVIVFNPVLRTVYEFEGKNFSRL